MGRDSRKARLARAIQGCGTTKEGSGRDAVGAERVVVFKLKKSVARIICHELMVLI